MQYMNIGYSIWNVSNIHMYEYNIIAIKALA